MISDLKSAFILISGPWLVLAVFTACTAPEKGITEFGGNTMGTTYQVRYGPTGNSADAEAQAVAELLAEINRSLSTYLETSAISRINRSDDTGRWHPIDRHFETVFQRAAELFRDTGGAFNPAVAPLVNAWGFGPEGPGAEPDEETIAALIALVSFETFQMRDSPPAVRKALPGAQLDFSAIAKGYGVDEVGGLIERWGVGNYFVEIGGEVRTRGQHPAGRRWRIGVERPTEDAADRSEIQRVLYLTDAALATSGTYRNYSIEGGRRIVHIVDPRTGYPGTSNLLSVTVIAEDTMTADAYATAFMVMGLDEAMRFVEGRSGLEAYFITGDGENSIVEAWSSGFPRQPEDRASGAGIPVVAIVDLALAPLPASTSPPNFVVSGGIVRGAGSAELPAFR